MSRCVYTRLGEKSLKWIKMDKGFCTPGGRCFLKGGLLNMAEVRVFLGLEVGKLKNPTGNS